MTARRFTDAQIKRIRKQAHDGGDYAEMADHWDCNRSHISAIARGAIFRDVGGPFTTRRVNPDKGKKKRATATNSRPPNQLRDFASLSIDDAARFLQALAAEWPKIRESFLFLDAIVTGQHHDD